MHTQIVTDIEAAISNLEQEAERLEAEKQRVKAAIKRYQKALKEIGQQDGNVAAKSNNDQELEEK